MEQTTKNKKKGLLILVSSMLGFLLCFGIFHLAGTSLKPATLSSVLKIILTVAFLPAGLYFGLYFISGKKLANQIGGGVTIFLIISLILGLVLH